ncbi:sensor histidine kinase [Euzebya tangerina]|uniref:sensor histidine kinase n=1 Tax=Euzebya tangerina TaxID=591198 RepID=UPI000E318397|nr:histidine kinase [Euzebya tangerina]
MSRLAAALAEPRAPGAPVRVWRDWVLVAVLVLGTLVEGALRQDLSLRPLTVVVTLTLVWPLLVRRSQPLAAVVYAFGVVTTVMAVVALVTGGPASMYSAFPLITVAYALSRWASGRDAAVGLGVLLYSWGVSSLAEGSSVGDMVGGIVALGAIVETGWLVRLQDRSRRAALASARSLERERIARELHDTVAHHVSAIAVTAQAGKTVAATDPEAAVGALERIEEAASRTLGAMRSLVGSLRTDDTHAFGGGQDPTAAAGTPQQVPAQRSPTPGLADLEGLGRPVGHGPPVIIQVTGPTEPVPESTGSAIYRIVQESITNARRHAVDATSIHVAVRIGRQQVQIDVVDDGRAAAQRAPVLAGRPTDRAGRGELSYGLIGMAERASVLGGTFHAGSGPSGWRVRATLPLGRGMAP